ncbi:hypothetical protein GCM10029992_24430 [Glycomyces albus]
MRTGTAAVGLDAAAHRLALADGTEMDYTRLLLATGSSPRTLNLPGADLQGVLQLRTVADADLLAATLRSVERIAVVGDGWIGMEVAASARSLGVEVTVLGNGPAPLRVLGPRMGRCSPRCTPRKASTCVAVSTSWPSRARTGRSPGSAPPTARRSRPRRSWWP